MTDCQGCGAWNAASRTLCVLCDAPLAETDEWDAAAEPPPLPSLPDGGLGAFMPTWLREPPAAPPALTPSPSATPSLPPSPVLGPRADPRAFLTDDDFPAWLRDLAARRGGVAPPPPAPVPSPPAPPELPAAAVADWPGWAELPASFSASAAPPPAAVNQAPRGTGRPMPVAQDLVPFPNPNPNPDPDLPIPANPVPPPRDRPALTAPPPRPAQERRPREPWETLLLVALFIGVVVAALWALVANGVFSPGL